MYKVYQMYKFARARVRSVVYYEIYVVSEELKVEVAGVVSMIIDKSLTNTTIEKLESKFFDMIENRSMTSNECVILYDIILYNVHIHM